MIIKIMLEYGQSPIWKYDEGIVTFENIPIIDNDKEINILCDKIKNMYSSYYEFNTHNVACWFNSKKAENEKLILKEMINELISKLNEINDGSFIVENLLSDWLNKD